jgi:hypothetical protein
MTETFVEIVGEAELLKSAGKEEEIGLKIERMLKGKNL